MKTFHTQLEEKNISVTEGRSLSDGFEQVPLVSLSTWEESLTLETVFLPIFHEDAFDFV